MGKAKLLVISLMLILLLPAYLQVAAAQNAASNADWPMFRSDLNHSGATNCSSQANSAQLLWAYPTNASVLSSPAVADGLVFFGCKDYNIYCLNATTGELFWSFPTGFEVNSSPAVYDGKVYVGSDDCWVYCINISSGMPVWITWAGGQVRSSPAVADGRVFVGSSNHEVLCFNASDGAALWRYPTTAPVQSSPAVSDGVVYVACDDFHLYALNASTGEKIWVQYTGSNVNSPCVYNGCIYMGAYDGWVTCINASTGVRTWTYQTQDTVGSSAAAAYGRVYVGSDDGCIYCLNATDGSKLWQTKTGYWVWSSPAVANGCVYVGSQDYRLYCLDAFSGVQKWTYETMSIVDSSPSVANNTLYFGSFDYHLYALRLSDATAETAQAAAPLLWGTVAFDFLFCAVWAAALFVVIRHLYIQRKNRRTLLPVRDSNSVGSWFSAHIDLFAAFLVLAFTVAFFWNLGQGPLWAADEKTYTQIAYHMNKSGDYFMPWVNGEPGIWTGKPPLLMWLISTAYQVFGVNNFSARVWMPVFGALSLAMVYFLGKKLYNAKAGLISVLVLGSFNVFFSFATHAMIDVILVFFMLSSMYFLLLSADKTGNSLKYAVLGGAFLGLAFLTKQLEALLIPAVMLSYFLFTGQIRFAISKRFAAYLGVATAIFVPWVVYMAQISSAFFSSYFVYSYVTRITNPLEGHTENYLYYFQYLLSNETVWAVLLLFAVGLCIYNIAAKRSKADVLVVGWMVIVLALFTFAQTKLAWYILPATPAFALAIGSLIYHAVRVVRRRLLLSRGPPPPI